MKGLLAATALTLLSQTALAQNIINSEHVVSDVTETMAVDIATAHCSDKGYGNLQLKVSVPELANVAIFNHVNPGETQPCMSAGRCLTGNMPSDLGAPGVAADAVSVRVQLVEIRRLDLALKTCTRRLEERVSATIRSKPFFHLRTADLGPASFDSCNTP